jgi:hypothetical protein
MIQSMPVNSVLIDMLTQIILSLNEQERELLLHQLQDPHPTDLQSLQQKIEIGAQQLQNGEYTDYTDETLPELLGKIRLPSVGYANAWTRASQLNSIGHEPG